MRPVMWPVTMEDVLAARERIRARLPPTPLRRYAPLEEAVGYGIRVYVKHENHQPTQAFKVRNALAALGALTDEEKKRGVVGASRGNHGQALAWAGEVLGVQAERAAAIHDSWHKGKPVTGYTANTFADGLATRCVYEHTFPALREGLAGFVKVSEGAIADAIRLLLRTTHNLAEGAGAAGLAGLLALRESLAGKAVGICISGGNIDQETLRRVVSREI